VALKTKHAKEVAQPDQFLTTSMQAVSWVEQNRRLVFGGLGLILLLAVGWIAWNSMAQERRAKVTRRLAAVLEVERAEVSAEPPPLQEGQDEEDRPLSFRTQRQKAERLVKRYKELLTADGGKELDAFAHVGLGGAYSSLGRQADAQKEYEAAIALGSEALAPYAIEGLVYVYEARDKRREALAKLDELKTLRDGAYRHLATYHIARLEIAEGKKAHALELLQKLQHDLAETPELTYLREQAGALVGQLEAEGVMVAGGRSGGTAPVKHLKGAKAGRSREGERGEDD